MVLRRWMARRELALFYALVLSTPAAHAGEAAAPARMGEVVVKAEKDPKGAGFKQEVEKAKLYAGKKTTTVPLDNQPQVQNNVYRQAFAQLPGLLVSEQNNHGHVNVNYRGIGDPHESQDLLTLKDGIPIGMERYGYSTSYYTPPLEAVESVELVRGGSALLYGPQPGPALNYVTYLPSTDRKFGARTQHIFGSDDFYGTYNAVDGTLDKLGYLAYFHHSQGDGPRSNEDFDIYGGSLKLVYDADEDSRWTYGLDVHEKDSGEPGRLTLAQFNADRDQTIRPSDRLETDRYAMHLAYERDYSEDTFLSATLYGSYFDRFSLRRTTNTSNANNLDRREVYSGGFEARVRHDYRSFGDHPSTLTAGAMVYGSDAPRSQDRSTTYPSTTGTPVFDFDYNTFSGAVFFENLVKFGAFSVAPAFRLEHIEMEVKENFNTGKTSPLHDIDESYTVPLFGLGLEYELGDRNEVYANVSQGFKPPQFDTLAPTGNNTLPATDLDEGGTWTYEAGLRGDPLPWVRYDVSAFLTEYDNFFGTVAVGSFTQNQNVGDAEFEGVEMSVEADIVALMDSLRGGELKLADQWGSVSLFGNVSFLDADFVSGPLTGREPAYAPDSIVKAGLVWRFLDGRAKIALLGTFVEEHFWADNNLAGTTGLAAIPAYEVWDLTSELLVYKDNVRVFFNIANLTDENYFSRVRSDGIEPAAEQKIYGGVRLSW